MEPGGLQWYSPTCHRWSHLVTGIEVVSSPTLHTRASVRSCSTGSLPVGRCSTRKSCQKRTMVIGLHSMVFQMNGFGNFQEWRNINVKLLVLPQSCMGILHFCYQNFLEDLDGGTPGASPTPHAPSNTQYFSYYEPDQIWTVSSQVYKVLWSNLHPTMQTLKYDLTFLLLGHSVQFS